MMLMFLRGFVNIFACGSSSFERNFILWTLSLLGTDMERKIGHYVVLFEKNFI